MQTPVPESMHVNYLVSLDGEQQHPMDVAIVTVKVAPDGTPDPGDLARLVERVDREIRRRHGIISRAAAAD